MTDNEQHELEQRIERIERVLVALSRALHNPWGLLKGRYRAPGEPSNIYNKHKYASPFEAIANLLK